MKVGDHVPPFVATLDDGTTVASEELLAAGPAVFFFYPKAFTPGCTAESCHFRDLATEFDDLGAQRFGVSRDDVETQGRFRAEYGLDFPLLADADGEIARAFGAKRIGPLPSKRQTFVVDRDGTLLGSISSELNMQVHADQALEIIREKLGITLDVETPQTADRTP